jgi:NAD(P)-dependent dehydrogenase (short-subunit alcohol dehydrogenase family)
VKNILFLHNNYPAQFGAIAHYLAKGGARVVFGTAREEAASTPDVTVAHYKLHREVKKGVHPYAAEFEKAVLTGQAVARMAFSLKREGFSPDVVMAHSGWGPGFYVKDV